jgi:hypothetical protein
MDAGQPGELVAGRYRLRTVAGRRPPLGQGQNAALPSPAAGQASAPSPAPSPRATSSPATPAVSTAGFVAYHDPSGFSIDIPSAWHVRRRGHLVYIQPAAGGMSC